MHTGAMFSERLQCWEEGGKEHLRLAPGAHIGMVEGPCEGWLAWGGHMQGCMQNCGMGWGVVWLASRASQDPSVAREACEASSCVVSASQTPPPNVVFSLASFASHTILRPNPPSVRGVKKC